jgi:predicted nucleic acid-binding protein
MRYVLDCSVAFKWVVQEVDTDKALLLRDDLRNGVHTLIAPDFFPVEVAHSLTRAERQRRITPAEGARALLDASQTLPQLMPSFPLLVRAYAISSQARVGVYDCVYEALSEREGCPFVTADDKLVRNLQSQFPFLVALSSLP